MTNAPRFASPVDVEMFGRYRIEQAPDDPRPRYRFRERITEDGSSGFAAETDRYHVYSGRSCPYAQRTLITLGLSGLSDVVSVSSVDGRRDGRGWAFRASEGPDPVNGFTLLREAYEETEPMFDGHVSVPTLWDRATRRVVSNDYGSIEIDLATQFGAIAAPDVELYPAASRALIDELDEWLANAIDLGTRNVRSSGDRAEFARRGLVHAFVSLDERLARVRYLLGEQITLADVRLFVTLVRYDTGINVARTATPGLDRYPNLWRYVRDLYRTPAFRDTTAFSTFAADGADLESWSSEPEGSELDRVAR